MASPQHHSKTHYAVLDSWRGIAACMVVFCHLRQEINGHLAPLDFIKNAYLFVDFFFVLSGFVISHAYASRLNTKSDLWQFMKLRFARLYPLHLFMLGAFVAFEVARMVIGMGTTDAPAFSGNTSISAFFSNLFLLHGMGIQDSLTWNTPSWSISTEFYA
ncbi:MAG: acyltransferase, partial [Cyanobacteria bacterium J06649_11]